jgi:hypothetical protein
MGTSFLGSIEALRDAGPEEPLLWLSDMRRSTIEVLRLERGLEDIADGRGG